MNHCHALILVEGILGPSFVVSKRYLEIESLKPKSIEEHGNGTNFHPVEANKCLADQMSS